eukprot:GHVR01175474.1.p1 GENE.GHVR01175474.1~~GHVR01175474.1.p1  ORF type:complete len:190 (+),score=43.28 GHVR01175474.1:139-708(+)
MDEVSKQLQATALHSESEREDRGSAKEKFSLRVTLNPRSQVKRALEETEEDDGDQEKDNVEMAQDSDSSGLFPDPAASCIRSLDAAKESATLIMGQVQRGRAHEAALKQQLKDAEEARDVSRDKLTEAEDTILTLEAKLKCSEAARDVMRDVLKKATAARVESRETTSEVQPASATSTTGVPHAERVAM